MRHSAPRDLDSDVNEFWLENWSDFEREDQAFNLSMFDRNRLFLNQGDGFLADASYISGVDIDSDSRATAIGDLNEDGRPDMVVRSVGGGPLRVFMNRAPRQRSVRVTLRGTRSDSNGIGAKLVLRLGERELYRENFPQNSLMAQCATETIFGLGDYQGPMQLTITWPSGAVQVIEDVRPGRVRISEADASERL